METSGNLSWTPFTDNLKNEYDIVDNELVKSIEELGLFSKAHHFGIKKEKGFSLNQVMFSILIWPLLTVTSLHFFCGNRLSAYLNGGKDVLYDFLKRQNINWRGYRFNTAKNFYHKHDLAKEPIRAATFDDTIKHRRGKKVSAVSRHFDHTLGKHYTATELFALIKRRMKLSKGTTYRTYTLNVQLDLSNNKKKPDLLPVKLLFSSSIKQRKENWVVFLSTDVGLSSKKIFEIYALRWSIEVLSPGIRNSVQRDKTALRVFKTESRILGVRTNR